MLTRLIVAAMFVVLVGGAAVFAQKPIKEEVMFEDSTPPPATIAEMIAKADGVVIARYTGNGRLREDKGAGPAPTTTIHSFDIVDVLKHSALVPTTGERLEIELAGGVREGATHIVRTRVEGQDSLRPGGQYVIFVRWVPTRSPGDQLVAAWSAGGIFDISNGRVRSLDRSQRRHDDKGEPAFVSELRNAVLGR
jgi:hypothetical protein